MRFSPFGDARGFGETNAGCGLTLYVIHRDVKPANILFSEDDTPVLTDFGIARPLEETTCLTQSGLSIGSPRYMSPEQLLGHPIDLRSDIYSLGIVFFEMLTGDVPWSDADNPFAAALKHCTDPVPGLPEDLAEYRPIVRKLLAKDPDDRYKNTRTLAEDLRRMARNDAARQASGLTKIVHPQGRTPAPQPRVSRKLMIVTTTLLASVGVGIGGYWLFGNLSPDRDAKTLPWIMLPQAKGERPIADKVEALVIELLKKEEFEQSVNAIHRGLETVPEDERLMALEKIVDKRWTAHRYLQAANNNFQHGKLENAAQEVTQGLSVIANHPQLLALRDDIAAALCELAEKSFESGDLESSRIRIDQGLRLLPDYPELLFLRDRVEQRIADIAQADEMLLKAIRLEEKEHWQEALPKIQKALAIAPNHSKLIAAKQRIEKGLVRSISEEVDRLRTEAQRRLDAGVLVSCRSLIQDGLTLVPDHPDLAVLRARVETEITRTKKLAGLLAKARERYADRDYSASSALLDDGLRLAPDHPDLLRWKEQVKARIEEENARFAESLLRRAIELKRDGKLKEADSLAEQGLALAPDSAELAQLRREVKQALVQRMNKLQEAEKLLKRARKERGSGDLKKALGLIEEGLLLVPIHPELTALQNEIQLALDQAEVRAGKLRSILVSARKQAQEGDLKGSLNSIAQGLMLVPDDPVLLDLRDAVSKRMATELQVASLRAEAQEHLQQGFLEEALQTLEKALELMPEDKELIALRRNLRSRVKARETAQLVNELREQAREKEQGGALGESLYLLRKALMLAPDDPELVAEDLRMEELVEKREKTNALLVECQAHYRADRLTTGRGETAFGCYQKVLELDLDNSQALEGIAKIANKYAGWASAKIDQRNPASARLYLGRLASVDPQYPQLSELRERLAQVERSIARSSAAPTKPHQTKRKPRRMPQARPIRAPSTPVVKKERANKIEPSTSAPKGSRPRFGTF